MATRAALDCPDPIRRVAPLITIKALRMSER
jgi:hypothetical protein